MNSIVVVGAGHAGFQAAATLRAAKYHGAIRLVNDEGDLPYQRPPLSKAFLRSGQRDSLYFRSKDYFDDHDIGLVDDQAVGIDRAHRLVRMRSGLELRFDHLILATGARHRRLSVPGAGDDILYLRGMRDADVLRPRLGQRSRVVLIGAGFIGLELAATAAAMGNRVDVVDVAERVMQRTSSPHVSSYFERQHRNLGVRFHLGTGVSEILRRNGHIVGVGLSDGRTIEADVVIAGIGVHANDHLAARSGLAVANGIVVDDCLLSTDESISAIGDCASFPEARTGRHVRLECVQNANDQARYVASRLTGAVGPYVSLPWFWSDQGEDKLQIAGSGAEHELSVVRPTPSPGKFSVFCFAAGHLVGVESVNRAADHLIARRLLMTGIRVDPAKIADPDVDLKSLLQ